MCLTGGAYGYMDGTYGMGADNAASSPPVKILLAYVTNTDVPSFVT